MHLLLDSGPLGLVTHPRARREALECLTWLQQMLNGGASVYLPEIVDYELRRELIRTQLKGETITGIPELDALPGVLKYLPLTTSTMRRAAELWARARNQGTPPTRDEALDVDMILSAQALELSTTLEEAPVIATTNIKHLGLFADARHWRHKPPPTHPPQPRS